MLPKGFFMIIDKLELINFRNFEAAEIAFKESTLIIGVNDVGKTNLIYALRLLLDKSLSDREIEPSESDFNIKSDGTQADNFIITIHFSNIDEEAVLAVLRGHISDEGKTILRFTASRKNLDYKLYAGSDIDELEEISSRFYLKYINLRYVRSQRDLQKFIDMEKKQLLKISQLDRTEEDREVDSKQMDKIGRGLNVVNERVRKLNYVKNSTNLINEELQKLSHTFNGYGVHLDSGSIKVQQFIDNLQLSASASGSKIMLGGDGRNNQILLALWKAKSQREHDPTHEVVFYCVEEPEVHLHPHQQRKLADYLIKELPGQTLITTHSPQITERYKPDSIVHLVNRGSGTYAASGGCSACISDAWDDLGYRMSILPAEAFFAKVVLLVEGPSEKLFYSEYAKINDIDLDFYNISILCVDGVQFEVYASILNAMEIPWVMRTDNDVSNITVKKVEMKNLAGVNRCLTILKMKKLEHVDINETPQTLVASGVWKKVSEVINPRGVYLSKVDLEHDLADELPKELLAFSGKGNIDDAVAYMATKKAIRMRSFLHDHKDSLSAIKGGELAKPMLNCLKIAEGN